MEVTMLHLYPDLMSLYGEYANLSVLRRHLEALGVKVTVTFAADMDAPNFGEIDLIYMGAGTERGQKFVLEKLAPHGDALRTAVDNGAMLLFTGNAMEILGRSVTDTKGKVWPGLGLADFSTTEVDRRIVEDVVAHTSLLDSPAVGFMNKCSITAGVTSPLFDHLSLGFGNEEARGAEGYVEDNVLATHITGPVLVKNPDLTLLLIRRLFAAKGWAMPEVLPEPPYERAAYEVTLRELSARVGS